MYLMGEGKKGGSSKPPGSPAPHPHPHSHSHRLGAGQCPTSAKAFMKPPILNASKKQVPDWSFVAGTTRSLTDLRSVVQKAKRKRAGRRALHLDVSLLRARNLTGAPDSTSQLLVSFLHSTDCGWSLRGSLGPQSTSCRLLSCPCQSHTGSKDIAPSSHPLLFPPSHSTMWGTVADSGTVS